MITAGVIMIVIISTAIFIRSYFDKSNNSAIKADTVLTGQLSFSTPTTSLATGSTFNVSPIINTGGQSIIGYTIIINYDSTKLDVVNTPPASMGSLLSLTTENLVVAPGKIRLGQQGTVGYNGSAGSVGTIAFRAKGTGNTSINYMFTAADANTYGDSDLIISGGDDILNSATPLNLTISFNTFSSSIKNRISSSGCLPSNGTMTIINSSTQATVISNAPVSMSTTCVVSATGNINLSAGTYNLIFNFPYLVRKTVNNVVFPGSTMITIGEFTSGDINNDGCVNIVDWGVLFAKWGITPTSAGWDPKYDLKGDNSQIGMEDWGVMYWGWNQGASCGP